MRKQTRTTRAATKKTAKTKRTRKTPAKKTMAKALVQTVARSRARKAGPASATAQHVPWDSVPLEELNPLIQRQFVCGEDVMVARILLKKGGFVPMHSHVNEQVTYVLEGALKFVVGGREVVVRAGHVLTIPPNLPHSAEALEDTVDLDVFNPPRADWINKTDAYLRQK